MDDRIGFVYKMIRFLDRGSFSTIYLGQNMATQENVAIKVQTNKSNMLWHEANILKYLHRQGHKLRIPTVMWFGQHKNQPCMIMTLYDVCLQDILFGKPTTITRLEELQEIMGQMLLCLQSIHQLGVLHRDIKPKNFMMKISSEDQDMSAELHLIDFGMATTILPQTNQDSEDLNESNTQSCKDFTGNLKYMSWYVEQGQTPSRRDDLISIGYIVILAAISLGMIPVDSDCCCFFKSTEWKKRENLFKILKGALEMSGNWRYLYEYMDYCYDLKNADAPKYYMLLKLVEIDSS